MSTLNNSLPYGRVGNACFVRHTPPTQEITNSLPGVGRSTVVLMVLGRPRATKQVSQCWTASQAFPLVWAVAIRKWEWLSIKLWTYFKLPNSGIWVTSICQIESAAELQGLVPSAKGAGATLQQEGQDNTIPQACEEVNWNCLLRKWAFWWKQLWDNLACTKVFGITLVITVISA